MQLVLNTNAKNNFVWAEGGIKKEEKRGLQGRDLLTPNPGRKELSFRKRKTSLKRLLFSQPESLCVIAMFDYSIKDV